MADKWVPIPVDRISSLCQLVVDDLRIPEGHLEEILKSLVHWWSTAEDPEILTRLGKDILLIGKSFASQSLADRLFQILPSATDATRKRVGNALVEFSTFAPTGEVGSLFAKLQGSTGIYRWEAAIALARLGITDSIIVRQLGSDALNRSTVDTRPLVPLRRFERQRFKDLHSRCLCAASAAEKGTSLEDLAEYLFLCLPGLSVVARRLRTSAEEIDLAFSNDGNGFLRELGDPFLVECKNTAEPISAGIVRDLQTKVRTKGLRTAFLVTTNTLTKDAGVAIRDAKQNRVILVTLDRASLAEIDRDEPVSVIKRCIYNSRLL